ncbi:EAL domain-containing protein [Planococcus salinarum]|uniref:EAL domain-containing protein n=1 Tax=Planococcus salinarum TaxID=622695 RepID=UPI001E646416|nr:EAL domain-containing protein [Planococcus salinarum]
MLRTPPSKKAVDKNQLALVYQPKVNLKTTQIAGMESLLRWNRSSWNYKLQKVLCRILERAQTF